MSKRRLLSGLFLILVLSVQATAQQVENFSGYFAEAYRLYPNLPKGLLEAAAYSASHMQNLSADAKADGDEEPMPQPYGIFGLVEDGRGYFKNNLTAVCRLSGITPEQFKKDVRLQVLAVAKFLSHEAGVQKLPANTTLENFSKVLEKLSNIPDDGSAINKYAHSLYTYDIYDHLRKGFTTPQFKQMPRGVQLDRIYAPQTLRTLSAPGVQLDYRHDIIKSNGIVLPVSNTAPANNSNARTESTNDEMAVQSADYPPALWDQANTANWGVGRGGNAITNVAVHTVQGSYSSCISWFNNPAAKVSAHYVVRSSDGQITQMVLEKDRAWHVADQNYYTIGIEHEGFVNDASWYTNAMYNSSAALVRDICRDNNIDPTKCYRGASTSGYNPLPITVRIKGHTNYPQTSNDKHTDPGINWNWPKYYDLINPAAYVTTITFAVKDMNSGLAVASASVKVTKPDGTTATVTTDANGKLTYGMNAGKYTFAFTKSGYTALSTFFTGSATNAKITANINLDPASSARIAAGSPLVQPSANSMTLTGYVRDADQNTPLAGAQVNAGTYTATTNAQGFFTLTVPAEAVTQGKAPATISVQSGKAGYISNSIKNLYAIPDTYEMQIALTSAASPRALAFSAGQDQVIRRHGLFDKTVAEQLEFIAPQKSSNVTAREEGEAVTAAALAVPAVVRVSTNCACAATCAEPVVEVMSLESYVQTGVDDEWVSSWNAASLQAGTVAYRSRGAWFVQHPAATNYDISSAACHQTWQTDRATSVKNAAIATAGIVLIKNGAIYKAEYCAESNNSGCGDGFSGTSTDYPCIADSRCAGRTKSGHGRGMCQWGSSFWGTDQTYTWILDHYYNPDGVAIQTSAAAATSSTSDSRKAEADGTLKIAPNPVTGSAITIEYTLADVSQPASIVITDNFGQIAQQRNVVLQQGLNRLTVNTSGLKAGVYNVTVRPGTTGKATSRKLLIVK
ncbi:N-acetylmuramoyl-L-alanine amidase [Niastella caeni]|nr:N-acetylmuramoyl-L-alanine amidase [Niastella caeni]